MSDDHNPEVGMPVDPENDWFLPELIGKVWRAGEIQDALQRLGFLQTDTDPNVLDDEGNPIVLTRNRRWVRDGLALRVPIDRSQIVNPYLAACVAGAMNG